VIDIKFFQASATVIPSLLIGVVLNDELMDNWSLELDDNTSSAKRKEKNAAYVGGITFVGWLLLTSIAADGSPLAALASGIPRFSYLVLVVVASSFQLTCLGVVVLAQAVSRVEKHDPKGRRKATSS